MPGMEKERERIARAVARALDAGLTVQAVFDTLAEEFQDFGYKNAARMARAAGTAFDGTDD